MSSYRADAVDRLLITGIFFAAHSVCGQKILWPTRHRDNFSMPTLKENNRSIFIGKIFEGASYIMVESRKSTKKVAEYRKKETTPAPIVFGGGQV